MDAISLYNNVGLISKGSEDIVSECTENRCFQHPAVVWRPLQGTLRISAWTLYCQKRESSGYIFTADCMGLYSFKFSWWAPKDTLFWNGVHNGHSRSSKVVTYGDLLPENFELFLPHSHLTPSIRMNPFEFLDECYITKTRVLRLPVSEDFVILVCVI